MTEAERTLQLDDVEKMRSGSSINMKMAEIYPDNYFMSIVNRREAMEKVLNWKHCKGEICIIDNYYN